MSKTTLTLLAIFFISIFSFAQQGINYKAILKDTNGNVLADTYMTIQFTIHQGSATGSIIYQEDHNYTTDTNGLVILNIGADSSPNVGTFTSIDWSADFHFLQTTITYNGGTINFDATEFMAVPYALHAANVSGLEKIIGNNNPITELPGYGWRLKGVNPDNYGLVGASAVDLSYSGSSSAEEEMGATGLRSFASGSYTRASGIGSTAIGSGTTASGTFSIAIGTNTEASGLWSTAIGYYSKASGKSSIAMGHDTKASGDYSTAMGLNTTAPSYAETVIGSLNADYGPLPAIQPDSLAWQATDRLFVIGNGQYSNNRSNALTVLKNGKTGINTSNPQSLFEVAHRDGAPSSTNLTKAFSIRNLGNDNSANTSDDESWQLYTEDNGYLLLFRNGSFRGAFNATTGAYGQTSDRRLKNDITALENGTLNKVMQLNPVSYLMKDQTDTKRNLGLISQEVQEIFPSITHYVEAQDILSLSYTELIPILIKALQEQQGIIEAQKAKDVEQDKSIQVLVARLDTIESKSSN